MSRYAVNAETPLRRCAAHGCAGVVRHTQKRGRPFIFCAACSFKQRKRGRYRLPKRDFVARIIPISEAERILAEEEIVPEPRPSGAEKVPVEQHDRGQCNRCSCFRWLYSFVGRSFKVCATCITRLWLNQLATGAAA